MRELEEETESNGKGYMVSQFHSLMRQRKKFDSTKNDYNSESSTKKKANEILSIRNSL